MSRMPTSSGVLSGRPSDNIASSECTYCCSAGPPPTSAGARPGHVGDPNKSDDARDPNKSGDAGDPNESGNAGDPNMGDAGVPNKLKVRLMVRNTAFEFDDPLLLKGRKNP